MANRSAARLTPGDGRSFAFTLTAAFAALAALMWWRAAPRTTIAFGGVAGVLLLAGLAVPERLGPVRAAWMGLAGAISKLTTPLFLGVVYFLVITPTGALRRLLGGSPLRRTHGLESGWVDRRNSPPGDLRRQF